MKLSIRIVLSIVIFLLSVYLAFIFEEDFRKLIRWLYENLSRHKISFDHPRKYIHFASGFFVSTIALFNIIVLNMIFTQQKQKIFINLIFSIVGFSISIFLFSLLDSKIKILQCTACDNGFIKLDYDDLKYDRIMLIALIIAIIPWLIALIINRKRKKNRNAHNSRQAPAQNRSSQQN